MSGLTDVKTYQAQLGSFVTPHGCAVLILYAGSDLQRWWWCNSHALMY